MLIGYARVSTQEQNLDSQMDALKKANCEKIFTDKISGAKATRPGLTQALESLKREDTLVVWKMDRLGRSIRHLIDLINQLNESGIGFKSLQENIDTTTSGGKLIFHIFASLAEFEKDLIKERTNAGLKAARARGRLGGRPRKLDEQKVALAVAMMKDTEISVQEVCNTIEVSKATLYRYLRSELAEKLRKQKNPSEIKLKLYLDIQRDDDSFRGIKKTRKQIEENCLYQFLIQKTKNDDYILTIPYSTDIELDDIVMDLFEEIADIAKKNNCYPEMELTEIGGDRFW